MNRDDDTTGSSSHDRRGHHSHHNQQLHDQARDHAFIRGSTLPASSSAIESNMGRPRSSRMQLSRPAFFEDLETMSDISIEADRSATSNASTALPRTLKLSGLGEETGEDKYVGTRQMQSQSQRQSQNQEQDQTRSIRHPSKEMSAPSMATAGDLFANPDAPGQAPNTHQQPLVADVSSSNANINRNSNSNSNSSGTSIGGNADTNVNASASTSVNVDANAEASANASGGATKTPPFPWILHQLLIDAETQGFSDVVSWEPDGRSFKVHQIEKFVSKIMPAYFNQSKYKSFQRQLNIYGYVRETKGAARGMLHHTLFVRGQPELCNHMKRKKAKLVTGGPSSVAGGSCSNTGASTSLSTSMHSNTGRAGIGGSGYASASVAAAAAAATGAAMSGARGMIDHDMSSVFSMGDSSSADERFSSMGSALSESVTSFPHAHPGAMAGQGLHMPSSSSLRAAALSSAHGTTPLVGSGVVHMHGTVGSGSELQAARGLTSMLPDASSLALTSASRMRPDQASFGRQQSDSIRQPARRSSPIPTVGLQQFQREIADEIIRTFRSTSMDTADDHGSQQ